VIWRRRPDLRKQLPGGGHQYYNGLAPEPNIELIPAIGICIDIRSIAQVLLDQILGSEESFRMDWAEHDRRVSQLPDQPDERFR
jgi:hypothetical protein